MLKLFSRKGQKVIRENYRTISILPLVLKILEIILYKQLTTFFENILSKYQCRFRKGHGTQHNNGRRLQIIKEHFGALLTDLSKAFDCLIHEILIAKLHAYDLSLSSLELVYDYLLNRKQRTKVNSKYSSQVDISEGVPQGSILGPIFFNIFLCDPFIIIDTTYFASYADDNSPYVVTNTATEVLHELETFFHVIHLERDDI